MSHCKEATNLENEAALLIGIKEVMCLHLFHEKKELQAGVRTAQESIENNAWEKRYNRWVQEIEN